MRWPLVLTLFFGYGPAFGVPLPSAEPPLKEEAVIAILIEALDDPDTEVRGNVAMALANLGAAATPSLLEAMRHPKPERRMGAAIALGQMRPAPKSAVPALLRALKDKDDGVRRQVSYALSRIVGRETVGVPRPASVPPPEPTPGAPPSRAGGPR